VLYAERTRKLGSVVQVHWVSLTTFKLADHLWSPNVVWNLLILALMYWSIFKGTWFF